MRYAPAGFPIVKGRQVIKRRPYKRKDVKISSFFKINILSRLKLNGNFFQQKNNNNNDMR